MKGTNISTYRGWKDDAIDSSKITLIKRDNQGILNLDSSDYTSQSDKLRDELGIFELNNKLEKLFLNLEKEKEKIDKYKEEVENKISVLTKPIIISEGNNKKYLDKAKEFFATNLDVEILEQAELGENEIFKLFRFLVKTQNREPKKIFIVDCDAKKTFEKMKEIETEYLVPYIFEQNINNTKIPKGIENLFIDKFYEEREVQTKHGASNTIRKFRKYCFLDDLCNKRNNKVYFSNFEPLFKFIENKLFIKV